MTKTSMLNEDISIPLCVDLDGTLIREDTTKIAIVKYLKEYFWDNKTNLGAFLIVFSFYIALLLTFNNTEVLNDIFVKVILSIAMCIALLFNPYLKPITLLFSKLPLNSTRAKFKQELAKIIQLTPEDWHLNKEMEKLILSEQAKGRRIYLVTATDKSFAQGVAKHLPQLKFTEILSSDGKKNIRAQAKADILNEHFGKDNYIYAGNSQDDFKVWKDSSTAILTGNDFNSLPGQQKFNKKIESWNTKEEYKFLTNIIKSIFNKKEIEHKKLKTKYIFFENVNHFNFLSIISPYFLNMLFFIPIIIVLTILLNYIENATIPDSINVRSFVFLLFAMTLGLWIQFTIYTIKTSIDKKKLSKNHFYHNDPITEGFWDSGLRLKNVIRGAMLPLFLYLYPPLLNKIGFLNYYIILTLFLGGVELSLKPTDIVRKKYIHLTYALLTYVLIMEQNPNMTILPLKTLLSLLP